MLPLDALAMRGLPGLLVPGLLVTAAAAVLVYRRAGTRMAHVTKAIKPVQQVVRGERPPVDAASIGLFCVVWVPRISRRSAGGGYRALRADTADQYAQTPTIDELVGSYLKPGQPARIFGDQPASAERLYVESEAWEQYTAATAGNEGMLERSYQQIVVYEATPWQSKK